MTRAAIHWILDSNNKRRRWIAAGIVVAGLAGMQQEPHGAAGVRTTGYAPVQASGNGVGFVNNGAGAAVAVDAPRSQSQEDGSTPEPGSRPEGTRPQTGGFVPSSPAAASDNGASVPASGDSVPESVNNNFSDYMRDQQRVVSENDGQTYIVNSNADPNQMTDTRDSVSGFTQATPGSDAAGYGTVAPSGATTVDTSTAQAAPAPVDTSSTSSAAATTTE